jgi:hypothetical protein
MIFSSVTVFFRSECNLYYKGDFGMCKLIILILFTVTLFIFPFAALSSDNNASMVSTSGAADISEEYSADSSLLRDQRVQDLENTYSEEYQAIVNAIEGEWNAAKRESLHEEAALLKADMEIAMRELLIKIAVEQGDKDRIAELEDNIDLLYEPKQAEPASEEQKQSPDFNSVTAESTTKNPDDQ